MFLYLITLFLPLGFFWKRRIDRICQQGSRNVSVCHSHLGVTTTHWSNECSELCHSVYRPAVRPLANFFSSVSPTRLWWLPRSWVVTCWLCVMQFPTDISRISCYCGCQLKDKAVKCDVEQPSGVVVFYHSSRKKATAAWLRCHILITTLT